MDASQLPKGQSAERDGTGRPSNQPGIYRHEAAGKQVITSADPSDGGIQADALVRVGYTRVADVPSRQEILAMQKAQLEKDLANPQGDVSEESDVKINGTTTPSSTELQEELAATKATLSALQAGLEKDKQDKTKK